MSEVDNLEELEALMREFPDWKEKYPELYQQLNPPRFHKHQRGKHEKSRTTQKRGGSVPVTDYQATYYKKESSRPRSTKRPPPTPRDPNPPPMKFDTNQRADFVPKDLSARPGLLKKEEEYVPPKEPIDGTTFYQQEFGKSYKLPDIPSRPKQVPSNLKRSSAKFETRTTNKEHYKQWEPNPSFTFGELPSFTQSILYPGKTKVPESTTRETFQGRTGRPAELAKSTEGNISIEGNMDLHTTNQMTYKTFNGAQPAQKIVYQPEIKIRKRDKFSGETQAMRDFPYYRDQPGPPKPAEPAPSTIKIQFDDRRQFDTEQRAQYKGVDTREYPMPKSCKKDDGEYVAPSVKFETTTSQKRDYKPIDVTEAFQPPSPPRDKLKKPKTLPKFDDVTMNKTQFKRWEVKPRVKYGDFHEGHKYVPPKDKFAVSSTTQDTFVAKSAEVPMSYKPSQKPIDSAGVHDFNTVYSQTYASPRRLEILSKSERSALLRELRVRKDRESKATGLQKAVVAN